MTTSSRDPLININSAIFDLLKTNTMNSDITKSLTNLEKTLNLLTFQLESNNALLNMISQNVSQMNLRLEELSVKNDRIYDKLDKITENSDKIVNNTNATKLGIDNLIAIS